MKLKPLKFLSEILVLVMLAVTVNCAHESAHAMQNHVLAASEQASPAEVSGPGQLPCAPQGQHSDCDDCDTCLNCACHAPLTVEPFIKLGYDPTMLNLIAPDPFRRVPEVYLSWFIPPKS